MAGVIGGDEVIIPLALAQRMGLADYYGQPCRICGRTVEEAELGQAKACGRTADDKPRLAHGRCWDGFLDTLRDAPAEKINEWRGLPQAVAVNHFYEETYEP